MVSERVQSLFLNVLQQDEIHSISTALGCAALAAARSGGKWGRVGLGEDTQFVLIAGKEGGTCV